MFNQCISIPPTRLALERSSTVEEAIETITTLVAEHNDADTKAVQQCFILAGANEVWLLNVVGKLWAAEKLEDVYRHIGVGLSVTTKLTKSSADLQAAATDLTLWNGSVRTYEICSTAQQHM